MAINYPLVGENSSSLNTGSYLDRGDHSLYVRGYTGDLWYGFSANDAIELGIYDRSENLVAWGTLNQEKDYITRNYSYINTLDFPVTYSYSELQSDFILYKNFDILVSPPTQLTQSFNIAEGSYLLTYNFTREMAGTPQEPLVIKEVSPSRKEIKLVPVGDSTLQYEAFCTKKILIADISTLYLQRVNACPYGQIYDQVAPQYPKEINTLKSLFFLNTNGAVINFLKNLYEDLVLYTNTPKDADGNVVGDPDRLLRVQGIRTYFSNYLRSNTDTISDFNTIDRNFHAFTSASIERKFAPVGTKLAKEYVDAKVFIYNFFTKYFYDPISKVLTETYKEKYFSYLRNGLNVGNGRTFPILNHDYLDEKIEESDPLTLIIKLKDELPSDVIAGVQCWVSNISLTPYVVNTIIRTQGVSDLVQIGPPDFNCSCDTISYGSFNKSYTANDLAQELEISREVSISKKQTDVNIDYSDFSNFVVFSSAEVRLNLFKNKVKTLTSLTGSVQDLISKNNSWLLASGSTYPYYDREYTSLQGQISEIVNNFDGYEAYLYRSGDYEYSASTFVSSSYVTEMDASASYYDRNNRDSLVNNTPEHILSSSDNDDYIVFLSMMGHYFDEIYAYIASLPSEKSVGQDSTETFTRAVTDYMLQSFGWKLDDTLEQATTLENYLTSDQLSGLSSMSAEDRTKTVRNRILLNLPKIYKTKGTEAAVKLLLTCYGIPTSLLSVREYGGVNYTDENASYTRTERAYMYHFTTSSYLDHFRITHPSFAKTIEYKFKMNDASIYEVGKQKIQWGVVGGGVNANSVSGSGYVHGGFIRERGKNMGKVFFAVGYQGLEDFIIYSDTMPIFDGNVYSVMVRRNDYDDAFQYTANTNIVPAKYDLYVQRNIAGRPVARSTSSHINYNSSSNGSFDAGGYLMIGNWFYYRNGQPLVQSFDKFMVWLDPITDSNFEDHVNNINSFAFSGSRPAHKSLVLRMHTDYPMDIRQFNPSASTYWWPSGTSEWTGYYPNKALYYANDTGSAITRFQEETGEPGITYTVNFQSWAPWSGSQTLVYDPTTCQNVSQSVYPYQFEVIDYPCTYATARYGPNRFRNEKIKYTSQSVEARLDIGGRSTYTPTSLTAADSNIVGFFADPNDFKNTNIQRYFGNFDFMNVIGSPSNNFSSSYDQLRVLRKQYANYTNDVSGSSPLLNEMISMYRLYFNRSIFEAIRNLVPARSNVLTGVLIEPSILERPKYQTKEIGVEMNTGSAFYADITASKYFRDPNTKMVVLSETLNHAEFNIDTSLLTGTSFNTGSIPNNLYMDINLSYVNLPSRTYPAESAPYGGIFYDFLDPYQFSHFGTGPVNQMDGDFVYGRMPLDMVHDTHPTGSSRFFLLKQWDTYVAWFKSGSWNRTENPLENTYTSHSIQLYKYIAVSEEGYNDFVYTASINNGTVLPDPGLHSVNTFKNTPNMVLSNHKANPINTGGSTWIMGNNLYLLEGTFYEIASGYPRNHYTHKRHIFSPFREKSLGTEEGFLVSGSYVRSRQTKETTIGTDGLENGSSPIETTDVSNVNVIQSDNVINQ